MNIDTILLLLKEKENLTLEFKERYSSKIDEDLVAFSNTKGGIILLGVNDSGAVLGQELSNDLKANINTLARNCKPSISVAISRVDSIVVIEVPEGEEKPYSCSAGYYRRLDGNSQKMSQNEIRIMFQENDIIPFESKINKACYLQDISEEKVKRYLQEAKITNVSQNIKDILRSANVLEKDRIKNAGVLLFAKDISKFLPQAKIDLIRFAGVEKVNIFDRLQVQDDLFTQFEQAIFFLKKHLNTRSEIRGTNRYDILEIPEEVLREAVANALIHRDYSILGTNISVEIYDDRVVILNPGYLVKGLTKDNFGLVSIRRNELLADIFYRMDKIERAGTGIRRMKKSLHEAGLLEPSFEFNSFFFITFKRPNQKDLEKVTEKVTENQKRIMEVMLRNPFITVAELKDMVNISRKSILENIAKLKEKGLLKRIGPDKGGHWEVKTR